MEYDEGRELTRYVWEYCGGFMTEFEQQMGRVILWRTKLPQARAPEDLSKINRLVLKDDDAAVEAALADGIEAYRRRVRERVIAEHGTELHVNRCPRCDRVVQTPQARQCFWCGFDWHD